MYQIFFKKDRREREREEWERVGRETEKVEELGRFNSSDLIYNALLSPFTCNKSSPIIPVYTSTPRVGLSRGSARLHVLEGSLCLEELALILGG